jgi:hypothetical protein
VLLLFYRRTSQVLRLNLGEDRIFFLSKDRCKLVIRLSHEIVIKIDHINRKQIYCFHISIIFSYYMNNRNICWIWKYYRSTKTIYLDQYSTGECHMPYTRVFGGKSWQKIGQQLVSLTNPSPGVVQSYYFYASMVPADVALMATPGYQMCQTADVVPIPTQILFLADARPKSSTPPASECPPQLWNCVASLGS